MEITNDSELPEGYSAQSWNLRQQVLSKVGKKYLCLVCATLMHEVFGDSIVVITSPRYGQELVGPGNADIGAPAGWHAVSIDERGNAWDNWGFQGEASAYIDSLLNANREATKRTFTRIDDVAHYVDQFRSGR